ncbi:hypothetical protein L596_001744 [Steinernema carpocapsae]|uniref:Uncharacterized protein n=1 Tax=Steinernema carpocapsae TaxID=34508 RepID=A0A4U8UMD9_STECR|nr:hypothetical protein L596_001744 [Steinernema carpocapsae]
MNHTWTPLSASVQVKHLQIATFLRCTARCRNGERETAFYESSIRNEPLRRAAPPHQDPQSYAQERSNTSDNQRDNQRLASRSGFVEVEFQND